MDTNEKVIQALHEFENMTDADKVLTQELEDVFTEIAHTGRVQIPWLYLKPVFMFKLDKVMRDFFESSPSRNTTSSEPTQTAEFDVMRQRLLDCVESFTSAPFTVQRLCELMTEPKRHYNSSDKFMRGVEKNVLVVSTMADIEGEELINNHETTSIPNGPVTNGIITPAISTEMTSVTDCKSNGNNSEYYHDMHNTTPEDIKQNGNALTEQKEITESSRIEDSKFIEDKSEDKPEEKPEEKTGGRENENENKITETESKSEENCGGDNSPSEIKFIEVKAPEEIVEKEVGNDIDKEEENLSNIDEEKDKEKENTKKDSLGQNELDKEEKECEDDDGRTINTDEPMEF